MQESYLHTFDIAQALAGAAGRHSRFDPKALIWLHMWVLQRWSKFEKGWRAPGGLTGDARKLLAMIRAERDKLRELVGDGAITAAALEAFESHIVEREAAHARNLVPA